ncbi:CRISPR-associated helicase Cas3' [Secundilactobacillus kimchicus]|uniref:CRISPR-associated helicase Cas3' n=1 Tax=Secundilactobacillus kimchicus TaxID=528209 RepID=UPI0024A83EA8|nr:CRISPR-associated helicase Cas3' [Secundilactobacillus kimchicus]
MDLKKLNKPAGYLWAKKTTTESGQELWLPLTTHLLDTERTIHWLFNNWMSEGTKQLLRSEIDDEKLQSLVKFLGFCHDFGKATPSFQSKSSYGGNVPIDSELIAQLIQSGFEGLGGMILTNANESPHAKAGEALLNYFKVPKSISAIVGGHHGDAGDREPKEQLRDYTANYWQTDSESDAWVKWKRVQNAIFEYGLELSGFRDVSEIPKVSQRNAIILEGLLITADWLASSEYLNNDYQKPLFPLIPINCTIDNIDEEKRFRTAMETWWLDGVWEPKKVLEDSDPYLKRWSFKARPVQQAMTHTIGETTDPGIFIIEAPMGLGKTEIALVAAEQLAYKTQRPGLFVGLPTQATSNAMFDRVQQWEKQLAQEQGDHFPINLMHGKAHFNEAYEKIPRASNVDSESGVDINEWFSGKKSVLSKFAVGTIDNLLLMALKQKHLFLKHLGFSEKVVVIDEVHAYDAYMSQYLFEAIKWLGTYHVPVVVLSATLPREKRKALISSYYKGKYFSKLKIAKNIDENHWSRSKAYPVMTYLDGPDVKQVTEFPGESDQKTVKVKVERLASDALDAMASVLDKIQNGGVAGVIVNTVSRAQELAKMVPAEVPFMLLHSSFLAPERAEKEQQIQAVIGKKGRRPEKLIVIGTQVLEQSLDIDFDILYTDIAPMDLILQRAGRLHRHAIQRPQGLDKPQLFVMGATEFGNYGDDNEAVYKKYLLMKTDYYLKADLSLPQDISNLVQSVYNFEDELDLPGLDLAKEKFDNDLRLKEQKAKQYRINDPVKRGTIHGWLTRGNDEIGQSDQTASAAVRDIKETIEVILLQQTSQGVVMLDGRPIESCNSKEIAEQLIRLPGRVVPEYQMLKAIKLLETRTLERFQSWQSDRWLHGAISLVLDETSQTRLNGYKLAYSSQYGLIVEKEDDDD